MLEEGKSYTTKKGDLLVTIMVILQETKTYYKCRCALRHKGDLNRVYDLNVKYILFKDRISNWIECVEPSKCNFCEKACDNKWCVTRF